MSSGMAGKGRVLAGAFTIMLIATVLALPSMAWATGEETSEFNPLAETSLPDARQANMASGADGDKALTVPSGILALVRLKLQVRARRLLLRRNLRAGIHPRPTMRLMIPRT